MEAIVHWAYQYGNAISGPAMIRGDPRAAAGEGVTQKSRLIIPIGAVGATGAQRLWAGAFERKMEEVVHAEWSGLGYSGILGLACKWT